MKIKYLLSLIIFTFFIFSPLSSTISHPHGWIENSIVFIFKKKQLIKIKTNWKLDEMNSLMLIKAVDSNNNDKLDEVEKKQLKWEIHKFVLENMANKNYYSYIKFDNNLLTFKPREFGFTVNDQDIITISFTVNFDIPVDLSLKPLSASFYDESYYYYVYFDETKPASFAGTGPNSCKYKIDEDLQNLYYYKTVPPQRIKLHCGSQGGL